MEADKRMRARALVYGGQTPAHRPISPIKSSGLDLTSSLFSSLYVAARDVTPEDSRDTISGWR